MSPSSPINSAESRVQGCRTKRRVSEDCGPALALRRGRARAMAAAGGIALQPLQARRGPGLGPTRRRRRSGPPELQLSQPRHSQDRPSAAPCGTAALPLTAGAAMRGESCRLRGHVGSGLSKTDTIGSFSGFVDGCRCALRSGLGCSKTRCFPQHERDNKTALPGFSPVLTSDKLQEMARGFKRGEGMRMSIGVMMYQGKQSLERLFRE